MSSNPITTSAPQSEIATSLSSASKRFLENTLAQATKRGYAADLKIFIAWTEIHQLSAIPATPETIANFLADQASGVLSVWLKKENRLANGRAASVATLRRRLAAIKYAHKLNQIEPSPTDTAQVRETLKGIRRTLGAKPQAKSALMSQDIQLLMTHIPKTVTGQRDQAILLLGFAGALRRSELIALEVSDVEIQQNGMLVYIRTSKTDQDKQGQVIGIARSENTAHCPVRAIEQWLKSSAIFSGPIFRRIFKNGKIATTAMSGQAISDIVKNYCRLAHLDASRFGAHSLRRGFVTSAAKAQVDPFRIMAVTRHKRLETVKRYVDEANLISDYPGADLLK
ncbi:tyrosine-type recombinase/integrase [Piscirickettsia litoralis]|uniref:Integrase n=1 Tax=Piscirickettsia litoralis TaxID=1891921 RepID=A0ABX3A3C5_9GAMM|nr:tyrosine-type recombinase/integrase [Piscirickettsia litoralis]ODN41870.1 integrase [Piscirickettsia litoralis]